jgi:hypothetical protein
VLKRLATPAIIAAEQAVASGEFDELQSSRINGLSLADVQENVSSAPS